MTEVVIKRELVLSESRIEARLHEPATGTADFVEVTNPRFGLICFPPSRVTIDGLRGSEINALDDRARLHLALTATLPDTKVPDLLTQAATKAKAGDVKEAVRLAVEALQKMAEGK